MKEVIFMKCVEKMRCYSQKLLMMIAVCEFQRIKNFLNVASNIAQDLISDIFGDKYDETTLQYHMKERIQKCI